MLTKNTTICYGTVAADGSVLEGGSDNWSCELVEKGRYRIRFRDGLFESTPVVITTACCTRFGWVDSGVDIVHTVFNASPTEFSVRSVYPAVMSAQTWSRGGTFNFLALAGS